MKSAGVTKSNFIAFTLSKAFGISDCTELIACVVFLNLLICAYQYI